MTCGWVSGGDRDELGGIDGVARQHRTLERTKDDWKMRVGGSSDD